MSNEGVKSDCFNEELIQMNDQEDEPAAMQKVNRSRGHHQMTEFTLIFCLASDKERAMVRDDGRFLLAESNSRRAEISSSLTQCKSDEFTYAESDSF